MTTMTTTITATGTTTTMNPHESPWVVTAPLLLLAIPSVVIGFMTHAAHAVWRLLQGRHRRRCGQAPGHGRAGQNDPRSAADGAACASSPLPFWLALAGVALSYYMYMVNPALPAAIKARVQPIYTLLDNKYYMDWFNENVLARGARALGVGLWKGGDQAVIDGAIVNGSWKLVGRIAGLVRWFQSGYLYHYALVMILGVFVLMTYFVWFNK
jgi:NADH-quinone oxidoreductase subunit L